MPDRGGPLGVRRAGGQRGRTGVARRRSDAVVRAPRGHRAPGLGAVRRVPDPGHAPGGTGAAPPEPDALPAAVATLEVDRRTPEHGPSAGAGPGDRGAVLLLRPAGRLGVRRPAGLRADP